MIGITLDSRPALRPTEWGRTPVARLVFVPTRLGIGWIAAALVALALAACGSVDDSSGDAASSGGDGVEVYAEHCASCHGADLRGTDKGPSFLSIVYEPNHHTDDSFRNAIANGSPQHHWPFGDMKPVEGLSDDEVESVIAYVRAEQERLGFEE